MNVHQKQAVINSGVELGMEELYKPEVIADREQQMICLAAFVESLLDLFEAIKSGEIK